MLFFISSYFTCSPLDYQCVQVMGSFDGWTQGEEMSPEYSGDYARFSTILKLRPGRYMMLVYCCYDP